jgi:hypothetical protein
MPCAMRRAAISSRGSLHNPSNQCIRVTSRH